MSVGLYDSAFVSKLQKWIVSDTLTITSPDETRRLFEWKADQNNDKPIQLPLIALRRGRDIGINSSLKQPATFDGVYVQANERKIVSLSRIPITVSYQIDIYTRYQQEADEYLRNFLFNIINYPTLNITIPYQELNYEHTSNIRLAGSVQDNSEIPERLIAGQFTRYTIPIQVDDAYLWSVPVRDNLKLETELQIKLKEED